MYNSESDLSQDDNNALQSILQANCDEVHSFNDQIIKCSSNNDYISRINSRVFINIVQGIKNALFEVN